MLPFCITPIYPSFCYFCTTWSISSRPWLFQKTVPISQKVCPFVNALAYFSTTCPFCQQLAPFVSIFAHFLTTLTAIPTDKSSLHQKKSLTMAVDICFHTEKSPVLLCSLNDTESKLVYLFFGNKLFYAKFNNVLVKYVFMKYVAMMKIFLLLLLM